MAFRAASSASGFATSLVVPVPAGVQDGDVMVAVVLVSGAGHLAAAPAGWTLLDSESSGPSIGTYYRVASSEPASYTWSQGTAIAMAAAIGAWSGFDTTTPIDVHGAFHRTAGSTVVTADSVTTDTDGCLLIFAGGVGQATTFTGPTGFTQRVTKAGTGIAVVLADLAQATAGATGSETATAGISGNTDGTLVVLKPVSVASPQTQPVGDASSPASAFGVALQPRVTQGVGKASGTFGKTTVGGTTDTADVNYKRVVKTTIGTPVDVEKLTLYLARGAAGSENFKGLIYADNAGAPGALLATSQEVIFDAAAADGWYDLPFASPVSLAAGTYWIGLIDGGTTVCFIHYDSVPSISAVVADTYSDGPTDPFGTPLRYDAEQVSVYASPVQVRGVDLTVAPPTPLPIGYAGVSGFGQGGFGQDMFGGSQAAGVTLVLTASALQPGTADAPALAKGAGLTPGPVTLPIGTASSSAVADGAALVPAPTPLPLPRVHHSLVTKGVALAPALTLAVGRPIASLSASGAALTTGVSLLNLGRATSAAAMRGATLAAGATTLPIGTPGAPSAVRGVSFTTGAVTLTPGTAGSATTAHGANLGVNVSTLAVGHSASQAAARGAGLLVGAAPLAVGGAHSSATVRGVGLTPGSVTFSVGRAASLASARGMRLASGLIMLPVGRVALPGTARGAGLSAGAVRLAVGAVPSSTVTRGAALLAGSAVLATHTASAPSAARGVGLVMLGGTNLVHLALVANEKYGLVLVASPTRTFELEAAIK